MRSLDTYARRGLWALPVWAKLLFYTAVTHQPNYRTDFAGWSRFVSSTEFLVSHLVGSSILGAGIGRKQPVHQRQSHPQILAYDSQSRPAQPQVNPAIRILERFRVQPRRDTARTGFAVRCRE